LVDKADHFMLVAGIEFYIFILANGNPSFNNVLKMYNILGHLAADCGIRADRQPF
jgi:hypothetical protein